MSARVTVDDVYQAAFRAFEAGGKKFMVAQDTYMKIYRNAVVDPNSKAELTLCQVPIDIDPHCPKDEVWLITKKDIVKVKIVPGGE